MLSIRNGCWASFALAALVCGCSEEPAAPTTGSPTPAPAVVAPIPPATPADKVEAPTSTPAAEPTIEAPKVEPATKDDAPKTAAAAFKFSDEELAAIKKLPADEQAVALKQMICPVGEDHLGAMGKPYKVTALGKTFYLCCEGCVKELEKDPKAVVAKLDAK